MLPLLSLLHIMFLLFATSILHLLLKNLLCCAIIVGSYVLYRVFNWWMNLYLALGNEYVSDCCPCHWNCRRWKNKMLYTSKVSICSLVGESSVFPEVIAITAMVWWRQNNKPELLYLLPAENRCTATTRASNHLWGAKYLCCLIW